MLAAAPRLNNRPRTKKGWYKYQRSRSPIAGYTTNTHSSPLRHRTVYIPFGLITNKENELYIKNENTPSGEGLRELQARSCHEKCHYSRAKALEL